jgi:hypothetical protein
MSKPTKRGRKSFKEKDEMNLDVIEKHTGAEPSPQTYRNKIIEDDQEFKIEISYQKINMSSNSIQTYNTKFLEDENIQKIIKAKSKLTFKKANWSSKFRVKEKNARTSKNLKNLLTDNVDTQSYNICNFILI